MQEFVLATENEGKVKEMQDFFSKLNIKILSLKNLGISLKNLNETGETFEENAIIKAEFVNEKSGLPAIADDSGLLVDALGGEPGIFSARYAGENASDEDRIKKILSKLKKHANNNRKACFICAICCLFDKNNKIIVRGKCEGKITKEPIGTGGFGYDPIFLTKFGKTFAQISSEQKNEISHRGKAIKELIKILKLKRG